MKEMKKFIYRSMLAILMVMPLALVSCGGDDNDNDGPKKNFEQAIVGNWQFGTLTYTFNANKTGVVTMPATAETPSKSIDFTWKITNNNYLQALLSTGQTLEGEIVDITDSKLSMISGTEEGGKMTVSMNRIK